MITVRKYFLIPLQVDIKGKESRIRERLRRAAAETKLAFPTFKEMV